MRTVARPSFNKNHVLAMLLLLFVLAAIHLGFLQTSALATTWQVWHCDPNTGPSLVEATLMDSGNYKELRGDNTKWIAKRIHLNNGAKLTLWSETGNKVTWGKLSVKTTKDHEGYT